MRRIDSTSGLVPVYLEQPGDKIDVRRLSETLIRGRWLILGITGLTVLLVALYTFRETPLYRSATTVQVETRETGSPFLRDLNPILLSATGTGGALETEIAVLESRQLAEEVVDSLSLHVRLTSPTGHRSELLESIDAPRGARTGSYHFELQADGSYAVRLEDAVNAFAAPARVPVGERTRVGDITLTLNPAVGEAPPRQIQLDVIPFHHVVAAVQRELKIERIAPQVLRAEYRSSDPELAAAVPNAVVQSYMRYKARTRRMESSGAVSFLREQVTVYEEQLRTAEAALQRYREQAHIVSPDEEASAHVRRLAELQARRDERRAEREALATLMERVHAESAAPLAGRSPYRHLAAYPPFLANRAVQDILYTITQFENRRADLLVRRTPENTDVQGITTRIEELEYQLFETADSYLRSLDNELGSLNASLDRFGVALEAIPAREVEFARLIRQQNLLEQLYTLLQTRLKEREIQEAMELGDVRVLDQALVPEKPVHPKPALNLLVAVVLGLVTGSGAAFLRRSLDPTVRGQDEVEDATGLPVLGTIPRILPAHSRGWGRKSLGWNGRGIRRPASALLLPAGTITDGDPHNAASEAFRSLRTNLRFTGSEQEHPPQVVVFTSAMPGDGKSVSASNMAIALAQQGTRALLVDGDLRGGSLHQLFDRERAPGFAELLSGEGALEAIVSRIQLHNSAMPLDFLGTGELPPNPAEILGSARMRQLLQEFRNRYEVVIFDAPPLNLVTDAAILARCADATILITRLGATRKEALQHAAAQLHQIGTARGVVVNEVDPPDERYYPRNGRQDKRVTQRG